MSQKEIPRMNEDISTHQKKMMQIRVEAEKHEVKTKSKESSGNASKMTKEEVEEELEKVTL